MGDSKKQEIGIKQLAWGDRVGLFAQDMILGGTSTSLSKTAMAPLERLKILFQTQSISHQIKKEEQYKGIINSFRRIIQDQGFLSLWRGNGINLIRYFPTQALNFAFKDVYKQVFMPIKGSDKKISNTNYAIRNMLCGGAAGATSLLGVYPLDLARTRITSDIGKKGGTKYTSMRHCLKDVYSTEGGIRGLYKGFGISVCGIFPYRAVYFGGYENLKRFLLPADPSAWELFCAAQATTFLAQVIAFPFDTTRRHMHLRGGGTSKLYNSSFDCITKIYQNHGPLGFYRGFLPSSMRSFGGALSLVLFDTVSKHMKFSLY